jgi:hypothetical protein
MDFDPSWALATGILAVAILHTFCIGAFERLSKRFTEGSRLRVALHLFSEVEFVFGFWAIVFLLLFAVVSGPGRVASYFGGLSFTEPLFVLAIMTVAATRPVIAFTEKVILSLGLALSIFFRMEKGRAIYFACLLLGPLLGSLITEPAAMTVTALIIRDRYYDRAHSHRFKYLTLATLFVNVSVGGVLTHFAAPPVLMVASRWNWDIAEVFSYFGWKAVLIVLTNAMIAATWVGKEASIAYSDSAGKENRAPVWLTGAHLIFLAGIVLTAHRPLLFLPILALFSVMVRWTRSHQSELRWRASSLVAFFLAGLVVLGGLQAWWLNPLIHRLNAFALFLGATVLTAFTDNAALTYLGAQLSDPSEAFKYALVAGAVAGGGLTVIANAPNPAGFSILRGKFGFEGIQPMKLLKFALLPTAVACGFFWLFHQ